MLSAVPGADGNHLLVRPAPVHTGGHLLRAPDGALTDKPSCYRPPAMNKATREKTRDDMGWAIGKREGVMCATELLATSYASMAPNSAKPATSHLIRF